jgi:hypothetical protein
MGRHRSKWLRCENNNISFLFFELAKCTCSMDISKKITITKKLSLLCLKKNQGCNDSVGMRRNQQMPLVAGEKWYQIITDRLSYDLPGPTTSVGTRTDYSVGLWDYPTCAARYLMA